MQDKLNPIQQNYTHSDIGGEPAPGDDDVEIEQLIREMEEQLRSPDMDHQLITAETSENDPLADDMELMKSCFRQLNGAGVLEIGDIYLSSRAARDSNGNHTRRIASHKLVLALNGFGEPIFSLDLSDHDELARVNNKDRQDNATYEELSIASNIDFLKFEVQEEINSLNKTLERNQFVFRRTLDVITSNKDSIFRTLFTNIRSRLRSKSKNDTKSPNRLLQKVSQISLESESISQRLIVLNTFLGELGSGNLTVDKLKERSKEKTEKVRVSADEALNKIKEINARHPLGFENERINRDLGISMS